MSENFEQFKKRIKSKEIRQLWEEHPGVKAKFFDFFYKELLNYENLKILEFGVRHGVSTSLFLDICNQKKGNLYSIDVQDYSYKFNDEKWKFIQSKDDDFTKVELEIPIEFDVIFLDTIHKAEHISNIFFHYYNKLKVGGLFIIDDISWLLYTKNSKHDHFFKEVNNHETFKKILDIYDSNQDKFDIHFNFCDTGAAKIIKRKQEPLNESKRIHSRENTLKNYLRKLYIKLKN
jgi:predicted O-methyltransferase YrrM